MSGPPEPGAAGGRLEEAVRAGRDPAIVTGLPAELGAQARQIVAALV